MHTYLTSKRTLLALVVAIVAGFVSAKWLAQGNPLVTVPWGIVAFLAAFVAATKREALVLGGCLGFVASYSYLWFDNTDSLTLPKTVLLIFLIALPALVGLLCGLACSWLGWGIRRRLFN